MRRIVVLRPGALGDAVCTVPVLEALRAGAPGAEAMVVGGAGFRLAVEAGHATQHVAFDDGRLVGLFAEGGSCPVVAGAELCIVYYGARPDPMVQANLKRSGVGAVVNWPAHPPGGVHIVDHLLGAVVAAGLVPVRGRPQLMPQRAWLAAAEQRLIGMQSGFAVVHPGSGGRAKRWPAERFAETARRLGRPVVWVLGPAEAEEPELRELGRSVGTVVADPPLRALAGLLARCSLYVGNDSGVSHLAAAVGAPTVAVFGHTDPAVWAPRGEHVVVVGSPAEGGLAAVSVGDVVAAAAKALPVSPSPSSSSS